jgi:hypothetical protein
MFYINLLRAGTTCIVSGQENSEKHSIFPIIICGHCDIFIKFQGGETSGYMYRLDYTSISMENIINFADLN